MKVCKFQLFSALDMNVVYMKKGNGIHFHYFKCIVVLGRIQSSWVKVIFKVKVISSTQLDPTHPHTSETNNKQLPEMG